MRYTRGGSFTKNLNILFGSEAEEQSKLEQSTNWCPKEVQLIAWIPKNSFLTDKNDINELCHFKSEGYEKGEIASLNWSKILVAKDTHGNETVLEGDEDLLFFKSKDFVYKVPTLAPKLQKLFKQ